MKKKNLFNRKVAGKKDKHFLNPLPKENLKKDLFKGRVPEPATRYFFFLYFSFNFISIPFGFPIHEIYRDFSGFILTVIILFILIF